MVPETGIEPARGISSRDFKSRASASSATPANLFVVFNIIAQKIRFVNSKERYFSDNFSS